MTFQIGEQFNMAKQVQFRRGTTAQHSTFTGLAGELTVDTTLNSIVVHDGSTAGGHTIATANGLTQSNVGMKGYVDDQITSLGSHYSNVDVLAYLTTNSYATETYATTAVTTANVAMKGYVDNEVTEITNGTNTFGNILPSANVTYNLGSPTAKWNELHLGSSTLYIGGDSLSTADITNWNTAYGWGDHSTQSYATTTDVTTANVGIKGYVDNEVSTLNSAITQANVGIKGYVDVQVTNLINAAPGALDTLDELAAAIGDDANFASNIALSVTNANVAMKGYVDNEVSTVNSAITQANVGLKGYTDNKFGTFTLGTNTMSTANGDDGIDFVISGANSDPTPAFINRKWRLADTGAIQFLDPFLSSVDAEITTTKVGNWDTAYGWGDHSTQGYLTSYTETNDLSASVTWTNIPDANVPQSAVTQHQAALSITESQISDLQSYLTSYTETNDLTASVTWTNIPDANVPSSAVTQHQANLSITESQISDLGSYVESDTTGITGADQVTNMVSLTQAEYDAITPNASTVYIIVG